MGKGSTDDLDAVVSAVVEGNGSTGIAQPRRRYRSNIPVVQRLQEVEEASLEERLAAEGKVFLMLKPETVKETRYRDRIDASFEDSEFQALKASIKSDGQMSPIGVRPVEGGAYEVIFGHRRLRACRELGFDVKAMVLTDVDDRKLILSMLRENTLRKDVSAYERGLAYKLYIDSRLLTQNDLADELGINKSSVSRYLALAKLPEEVLDSVGDPREIKLMTGNEIFQLWNDASKSTRNAALKALDEMEGSAGPEKRIQKLLRILKAGGKVVEPEPERRTYCLKSGFPFATLTRHRDQVVVRFSKHVSQADIEQLLEEFQPDIAESE